MRVQTDCYRLVPWLDERLVTTLERFAPWGTVEALVGKLQHAMTFAARAPCRACLTVAGFGGIHHRHLNSSGEAWLVLPELLATIRDTARNP